MNKDFDEMKERVEMLFDQEMYVDAFKLFIKLHILNPDDKQIVFKIMHSWQMIENDKINFAPKTAEEYLGRGLALSWNGKLNEAMRDINKALTLNPNYDFAYKSKGMCLFYFKKFQEAIYEINHAIRINPLGDYYEKVAICYEGLNKNEEALEFYNKAITASPDNNVLWNSFGVFLSDKMEDETGALEKFEKALELMPSFSDAEVNRDSILTDRKENDPKP